MQLEMGKGAHIGRSLEIMAYALDKLQIKTIFTIFAMQCIGLIYEA